MPNNNVPRFIVLEGVDGVGKSALFSALSRYYAQIFSNLPLYADAFPGSQSGTLGEWVYRFHRNRVTRAPSADRIAVPALQLLHMAAHVDTVINRIAPTFEAGGNVLLDRSWWSAYAYSRTVLTIERAREFVAAERIFWEPLLRPVVVYVDRSLSLKPYQIDQKQHRQLDGYYRELIAWQREEGLTIHELNNDGSLADTWRGLLDLLHLPAIEYDAV